MLSPRHIKLAFVGLEAVYAVSAGLMMFGDFKLRSGARVGLGSAWVISGLLLLTLSLVFRKQYRSHAQVAWVVLWVFGFLLPPFFPRF